MHPNPAFRKTKQDRNVLFARDRGFGTLSINGEHGPIMSHIPFQLSEDGSFLEAHLVRSNPIIAALKQKQNAVMAVVGPDSYVSPDWYKLDDQVPTWNYVAVHLRGQLQRLPEEALEGILERLSGTMEAQLLPKQPWKIGKLGDGIRKKMLRQIIPIALDVTQINGTWKLAQNKPEAARVNGANGVEAAGFGSESGNIARLMRDPPA